MSEQELTLEDRVKNIVAGGVAGAAIHHAIGMLRVEMESQNGRRLPSPHGKEIGPLVMMASMFFPEHRAKYLAAGFGAGMTLDDLIYHTLEELNTKPLTINQTGDLDIIEKYSKLIHIDENLSAAEKEDIIFPIFPQVIEEQRENPMQISALDRWKQELNLNPNGMKLIDAYWVQQWFLYWGTYSGNEGLYGGHDRFRTIAKLMRVRDRGDIKKNGHPSFIYDCLSADTLILCYDPVYGYARVRIADMKVGDLVLSYNFANKCYEFKKVLNVLNKGILPIYKIRLRNGTTVEATADHKFFRYDGGQHKGQTHPSVTCERLSEIIQKQNEFTAETKIDDVGNSARMMVKFLSVRDIPTPFVSSPKFNHIHEMDDDLLWVIGHYIAEGTDGKIITSSHGDKVSSILSAHGIKHTAKVERLIEGKELPDGSKIGKGPAKDSNYTYIFVHVKDSKIGEELRETFSQCGNSSFTKKLPSWAFTLSDDKLAKLLEGYYDGDGWKPNVNQKGRYGFGNIAQRCVTVSKMLKDDLRLAHFILGRPVASRLSDAPSNYNSPIWVVEENPTSYFNYEIMKGKMPGVSKTTAWSIEPTVDKEVFDIEVEDNHNFILADSGLIVHNCDCGSIATNQLVDSYGYDYYYMLISQRGLEEDIHPCHHIFPIIEGAGRKWVCETIKELPMVPIEYIGKLFAGLTRAVIVNPNGEWYEYDDWREYTHKPKVR